MRRAIIWVIVVVSTFLVGVKVGRVLQDLDSGYRYEVRTESAYASPFGKVRLEYATEAFGLGIIDPGNFTIFLEDRGLEVVLYKAKRTFQESWPAVHDVSVTDDRIQWDDGCRTYRLQLGASERGDRDRGVGAGDERK